MGNDDNIHNFINSGIRLNLTCDTPERLNDPVLRESVMARLAASDVLLQVACAAAKQERKHGESLEVNIHVRLWDVVGNDGQKTLVEFGGNFTIVPRKD
jgi:hypothetical protein